MNMQTFNAMRSGAKAMQDARGRLDVDQVDDVMDDIKDEMDIAEQVCGCCCCCAAAGVVVVITTDDTREVIFFLRPHFLRAFLVDSDMFFLRTKRRALPQNARSSD